MVSIVNGRFTPLPFKDIVDSTTGRTRVRMVDVDSESYKIARAYMARLEPEDLANIETVSQYAEMLNMTPDQFRSTFDGVANPF